MFVHVVIRHQVNRRIGRRIQPWNEHRGIAIYVDPRTDIQDRRRERELIGRFPRARETRLMRGTAEQLEVGSLIACVRVRVVDAYL